MGANISCQSTNLGRPTFWEGVGVSSNFSLGTEDTNMQDKTNQIKLFRIKLTV